MDIIKKLDIAVCFGSDRFQARQGEWEMMTSNGKHRWVFPLVPTDCAYAKLDEYFGKLRKAAIGDLQTQGDFRRHLEAGESRKAKIED